MSNITVKSVHFEWHIDIAVISKLMIAILSWSTILSFTKEGVGLIHNNYFKNKATLW